MRFFTFIISLDDLDKAKMTFRNYYDSKFYKDISDIKGGRDPKYTYTARLIFEMEDAPQSMHGIDVREIFESDRDGFPIIGRFGFPIGLTAPGPADKWCERVIL